MRTRTATTREFGTGRQNTFKETDTALAVFATTDREFTELECSFLLHRNRPDWHADFLRDGKTVGEAVNGKCLTIYKYDNGKAVKLLNMGSQRDLTRTEMAELREQSILFGKVVETYNLVMGRGKSFALAFIK